LAMIACRCCSLSTLCCRGLLTPGDGAIVCGVVVGVRRCCRTCAVLTLPLLSAEL
jgi:hypothetical protein